MMGLNEYRERGCWSIQGWRVPICSTEQTTRKWADKEVSDSGKRDVSLQKPKFMGWTIRKPEMSPQWSPEISAKNPPNCNERRHQIPPNFPRFRGAPFSNFFQKFVPEISRRRFRIRRVALDNRFEKFRGQISRRAVKISRRAVQNFAESFRGRFRGGLSKFRGAISRPISRRILEPSWTKILEPSWTIV